ncbi:MAG: hypothetical protein D6724_08795 [Armatimonadetes bacterium]|nr:MAG: hypothetical protein D6724_08795 [Armatimonadota bacterium]
MEAIMRNTRFNFLFSRGACRREWILQVTEQKSRVLVCEVTLTDAEMGAAIGAMVLSGVPGRVADPEDLEKIGRRKETGEVLVDASDLDGPLAARLEKIGERAEQEVSQIGGGWQVVKPPVYNHHDERKGGKYRISIERWIDPDGEGAGCRTGGEGGDA